MKFSIVTISLNQGAFIRRAIDSVIGQDGVEAEYIVVDPGSTDGSRDIIDSYGDAIAKRIYRMDRGPADGLNMGFAEATGDIYCYLNSDDSFEPGALARVADAFAGRPDLELVYGHAWIVGPNDEKIRRMWSNPIDRLRMAYAAAEQVQPSTFFRAELFRRAGGFNIENKSNWDAELMTDMLLAGARHRMLDAFLSNYRLHETSITTSGSLEVRTRAYWDRRFRTLMGRDRRWYDDLIGRYLRVEKNVRHPVGAWERIAKGPIFKRKLG